jgi:hypothetical protein
MMHGQKTVKKKDRYKQANAPFSHFRERTEKVHVFQKLLPIQHSILSFSSHKSMHPP